MSNRFEEIEEQLKQLETIPLVSAGARATEIESFSAPERSEAVPAKVQKVRENGQNPRQPERAHQVEVVHQPPEAASGLLARTLSSVLGLCRWSWKIRLKSLEDQVLAECQERMREVVGDVIEDARRQLEVLTNELVPTFRTRLEKSINNSARSLASQLASQGEKPGGITDRSSAPLGSMSPEESPAKTWHEGPRKCESSDPEHPVGDESIQQQLAYAFSPVVEEIQNNSAAFLDHLNLQLHSTLRAFGEKATRHAAEEFGRIAVEVLQDESRRSGVPRPELEGKDCEVGSSPKTRTSTIKDLSANREAISALKSAPEIAASLPHACSGPLGPELQRGEPKPHGTAKPSRGAPNWRILGLS